MNQSVLLLIPLAVIVFWLWMFYHMLHNDDIPSVARPTFAWPPEAKNQWLPFFIVLNVITALYYFFTEFARKRS